jgi:hypothetical protein
MKSVCIFLVLVSFTSSVSGQNKSANGLDSIVFDNPYLQVSRNIIIHAIPNAENFGSRIIAALDKTTVYSSKGNKVLERGEVAVFLEKESYEIKTGSYFEIAFKKNHPPLTRPESWVEPLKNKVVYEDDEFRIFEERLDAGDIRELHSHAQRLVVRLNEVQLTDPRFNKEVKAGTGIQVPNTVKFAEPIVHAVKNLSKIPLFNLVIEFKISH